MTEQRNHYLTDEYRDKLAAMVADSAGDQGVLEEAIQLYLNECRKFETFFKKGAPIAVIRRTAFHQTERTLLSDR